MKKRVLLSLPELGLIAATRGMIGAGIGLLLADRMSREKRRAVGLSLFIAGAISTIPIAIHLFGKDKPALDS